jgi:hypothetical protein
MFLLFTEKSKIKMEQKEYSNIVRENRHFHNLCMTFFLLDQNWVRIHLLFLNTILMITMLKIEN